MGHAFDVNFTTEIAPLLLAGIYTIPEESMVGETEEFWPPMESNS
jgi:hypothetical protein